MSIPVRRRADMFQRKENFSSITQLELDYQTKQIFWFGVDF